MSDRPDVPVGRPPCNVCTGDDDDPHFNPYRGGYSCGGPPPRPTPAPTAGRDRCDSDRECAYVRASERDARAQFDRATYRWHAFEEALGRVRGVLAREAAPAMLQVVRWVSTTPSGKDLRPSIWRCNACGAFYGDKPAIVPFPPNAACVEPACHAATAARVAFAAMAAQVDPHAPTPVAGTPVVKRCGDPETGGDLCDSCGDRRNWNGCGAAL